MSEPLTAVITRDGTHWKATVDSLGELAGTSLVELTYLVHAYALETTGKPQAIEFHMPYAKDREQITDASLAAQKAATDRDAAQRAAVKRLYADGVSVKDIALLLGLQVAWVRSNR